MTIYNVVLTSADTEYSQVLPIYTKKITIQARTSVVVRGAYEVGKVATPTAPYLTIKAGASYWEDSLTLPTLTTIYLASSSAGTVVEIMCWE